MAVVAGIDGCPFGWLCLIHDLSTGIVESRILPRICDLLSLNLRPTIVMLDVPIGLTDAGPRQCDLDARAVLGRPRASSVFPAPVRPTLVATNYLQACQLGMKADGRKLSRQAWAILPKISEVDSFLRSDTSRQQWIREVHPECAFGLGTIRNRWHIARRVQSASHHLAGSRERHLLF
jgi:predicted RNase H-like nuclease